MWNILSVSVILTLFCAVYSDDAFLNETIHIRVKRGKYYSYPSRFYRRPPITYPTKGAFSYTPPPGYMMDDEEPHPGRPDPRPKVSKRPNDGLRDEDINNIVKYLSKQDLGKLIDFASDKERVRENSVDRRPYKPEESRGQDNMHEYTNALFSQNGPYKTQGPNEKINGNGHWISQDPQPQNFKSQDYLYISDNGRIRENSVERRPHKRDESRVKNNVQGYTDPEFSQNNPYKTQELNEKFNGNGHWTSQDPEPSPQNFKSQDYFYNSDTGRIKDNSVERRPHKRDESRVKNNEQEYSNPEFSQNNHWTQQHEPSSQSFQSQDVYNGPYRFQNTEFSSFKPQESQTYNGPFAPTEDLLNLVEDAAGQTEESMQDKPISYLNAYIHHEINNVPNPANVLSDGEVLPRPVNLREEDFDISYTNNVPTVVKGPSYKVENFGELPLMSNAYKLDTVSSYKVPHYTITSNSKYSPPPPPPPSSSSSSSSNVPLEPAPPVSAAKEQSDAHLKATNIWTSHSQGTAYTLHNDGTLSLEKPGRPKTKYGP